MYVCLYPYLNVYIHIAYIHTCTHTYMDIYICTLRPTYTENFDDKEISAIEEKSQKG